MRVSIKFASICLLLSFIGCAPWIQLKRQGNHYCGPACLASVAHVSIDEAAEAIGFDGPTHGGNVCQGLNKLGIKHSEEEDYNGRLPDTAIVRVRLKDYRAVGFSSHWIIFHYNKFYDPLDYVVDYELPEKYKILSYIPVYLE